MLDVRSGSAGGAGGEAVAMGVADGVRRLGREAVGARKQPADRKIRSRRRAARHRRRCAFLHDARISIRSRARADDNVHPPRRLRRLLAILCFFFSGRFPEAPESASLRRAILDPEWPCSRSRRRSGRKRPAGATANFPSPHAKRAARARTAGGWSSFRRRKIGNQRAAAWVSYRRAVRRRKATSRGSGVDRSGALRTCYPGTSHDPARRPLAP